MWLKPKVNTDYVLANVGTTLYKKPKAALADELGVELEIEGDNFEEAYTKLQATGCDYWLMKTDGSLQNGNEFVFNKPLNRADATKAITDFYKVFNEHAVIRNSQRCSTHMHLNFQHMSILQVYSFLSLFYVFEYAFFKKFAPERMGNGYCMPLYDYGLTAKTHKKNLLGNKFSSPQRYQSLNTQALTQYGSIECRMLGESSNAEKPLQWMNILLELYDYIKNNPLLTPAEILVVDNFPEFTEANLPKTWEAIKDMANLNSVLQFGVDSVQEFAFTVDWNPCKTASAPATEVTVKADEHGDYADAETLGMTFPDYDDDYYDGDD